jgi:crotonobetainyl-CoA:carnitine CoA-transferase CaiB-like acyl-CoA transferase
VSQPTGLLTGVRVLELSPRISGPYCGKILAHMGAEVLKIEPPEGDATRRMGPFPGRRPHAEKSGLFLWLNANKYSVKLDLERPDDRRQLRELAQTAAIIIEDEAEAQLADWELHYETLHALNPSLVLTSITPFGNWGPYAALKFKTSDLVLFHMSGNAHGLLGPVDDPEHDPPIRAGGHQAELVVGLAAATATLSALYRQRLTGSGCHVRISAYEATENQLIRGLANCAYAQPAPTRD